MFSVVRVAVTSSSRRSPVEIVATMGTYLARSPGAEFSGLRTGRFGRWADGVNAMRMDCAAFAGYWRAHNGEVLSAPGPLWVVLGNSTAQGLGAPTPEGGISAVPDGTVLLDLPVLARMWGVVGRAGVPYVTRINRVLHDAARERGLRVARISEHFTPPWVGKFASDRFHPSQNGYRDWTRALLTAIA